MDLRMNAAMRAIFENAGTRIDDVLLPARLAGIAAAGFVMTRGRLLLTAPEHTSGPAAGMDSWEAERWVNKIHLDTSTPPDDESWRPELLGVGLTLARRLLPRARQLTDLPVQAIVSLQSSKQDVDPDIDYATGAIHLYLIRAEHDDLAPGIEGNAQPCLTLTDRPA